MHALAESVLSMRVGSFCVARAFHSLVYLMLYSCDQTTRCRAFCACVSSSVLLADSLAFKKRVRQAVDATSHDQEALAKFLSKANEDIDQVLALFQAVRLISSFCLRLLERSKREIDFEALSPFAW